MSVSLNVNENWTLTLERQYGIYELAHSSNISFNKRSSVGKLYYRHATNQKRYEKFIEYLMSLSHERVSTGKLRVRTMVANSKHKRLSVGVPTYTMKYLVQNKSIDG